VYGEWLMAYRPLDMPDAHEPYAGGWRRWLTTVVVVMLGLASTKLVYANQAQDRLAAMSEVDRSEALAIFIESSGQPCRTVARTFFQGKDDNGNVLWNVECSGGNSYVVQIKNDLLGSTRVLSCRRLEAASRGRCFKKLE
jgi:hypothetical protein